MRVFFKDPVPDLETAIVRARFGASYLDYEFGADWVERIDVSDLDVGSLRHCVLGQLIRQGNWRLVLLPLDTAVSGGFSCGVWDFLFFRPPPWIRRSFQRLTKAWKMVLRERRVAKPIANLNGPSRRQNDSGQSSFSCAG